jgi:hypothetical protein
MEEQIKILQQMFREEIIANRFKVVDGSKYQVTISVNGYNFNLWMGAGKFGHNDMAPQRSNFMDLDISGDLIIKSVVHPAWKIYLENTLLKEKLDEVEKLRKEITEITEL